MELRKIKEEVKNLVLLIFRNEYIIFGINILFMVVSGICCSMLATYIVDETKKKLSKVEVLF